VTVSPADILRHIAEIGGLEVEQLVGPGHTRPASLLRRAAIELLRSDAGLSLAQIAQIFGRSHQWAYYLSASLEGADRDPGLKGMVVEARCRLYSRWEGRRCRAYEGRPEAKGTRQWLPSLATYRQAAHVSIKDLGARAGLPRETLSRLERLHRRARSGTAEALACALGVPVERLAAARALVIAPRTPLRARPVVARRTDRAESDVQVCTDCGLSKLLDCFTRIPACRDGFYGRCKQCRAARAGVRYRTDAEFSAQERERAQRTRVLRKWPDFSDQVYRSTATNSSRSKQARYARVDW